MSTVSTYSTKEIDELVHGIYKDLGKAEDHFPKSLDDIYLPFNNIIAWLTTRTDQMKKSITRLQEQHTDNAKTLTSIYDHTEMIIDDKLRMVYARLRSVEEGLYGIRYPV